MPKRVDSRGRGIEVQGSGERGEGMIRLCKQIFVCSRRGHVEWPEGAVNPLCWRCGKWLEGTEPPPLTSRRL